jgi:3-deoxy-7-phosphoheptulonate synthase
MILVDFHPRPQEALCDGPQALLLEELEHFVRDAELVRTCYEERRKLRDQLDPLAR